MLGQWLRGSGAVHVQVDAAPAWIDPDRDSAWRVVADPTEVCTALAKSLQGASGTPWLSRWQHAERKAQAALDAALAGRAMETEPGVARAVLDALPDGSMLVVSSSMPVRDVEWFGRPHEGTSVIANRGANGIDGVVSTAVGVALGSGRPTALLIGDIALLHDANGLIGAVARGIDLTIVCVDNDGGGIFSFLPQAAELGHDRFEQLFGTPHGTDLDALAAVHGVELYEPDGLSEALHAGPGVRLVRVRTERGANVAVHRELEEAVRAAL